MGELGKDVWLVHPPGVVRDLYAAAFEEAGLSAAVSDDARVTLPPLPDGRALECASDVTLLNAPD